MSDQLLTTTEMCDADARTIAAGVPGFDLMTHAGATVADAAEAMAERGCRVLVVCGPGNNGGDGFVAARLLAERGYVMSLVLLGTREALKGDAALAAADWRGSVGDIAALNPDEADVLIDALFGAGLTRDLDGAARTAVERMNAAGKPILAVDIPSGIDGDTGQVRGVAVKAVRTITFARRKPGHLLLPGRAHCGPVEVADIGIADVTIAALGVQTFANGPDLWRTAFPRPDLDAHKYKRGHAVVVSANAAHLIAIMLRRCDRPPDLRELLTDARFNAVALGPALGIGAATREMVEAALGANRATVLDADALTSFAGDAAALTALVRAHSGVAGIVLTPHDGEFARLFASEEAVLNARSKLDRARGAAALVRAVVVLKGPDTVIAAPDGRAAINENGTPYLATAGSGDVLSGLIAGLLAQGMPPFEAAAAGVWLHAETGARFGPGLIAEDLPEGLPAVLRDLLDPGGGRHSKG